jgi:outer membrane protein assembly factor BamB
VWAIDLNNPDPTAAPGVTTFATGGGNFLGLGGPVIGNDGTVYVQTGDGPGPNSNALLALEPKKLELKGSFVDPNAAAPAPKQDLNSVTPVVFEHKGRDVIVSVSKDGRLYLNDLKSIAAQTPLAQTGKIAPADGGLYGGLATWADTDGTRYVLASVWGKTGNVVAYKVDDSGFTQAWMSREMTRPVPPVIANGMVFALSSGGPHAVLYALDAATGKELWSSRTEVTAAGNLAPITVANGRIYFTTVDSTLWTFGMPLEW